MANACVISLCRYAIGDFTANRFRMSRRACETGTVPNLPPNVPEGTRAARPTANAANTRALRGTAKTVTADSNGRFRPLLAWQRIQNSPIGRNSTVTT